MNKALSQLYSDETLKKINDSWSYKTVDIVNTLKQNKRLNKLWEYFDYEDGNMVRFDCNIGEIPCWLDISNNEIILCVLRENRSPDPVEYRLDYNKMIRTLGLVEGFKKLADYVNCKSDYDFIEFLKLYRQGFRISKQGAKVVSVKS